MKTKVNSSATRQEHSPPSATLRRLLLGASVTLALVAGCSSSDDDGELPDGTGASLVGYVSVEVGDEDDELETDLNAVFIRIDDTKIIGGVIDALATLRGGDDICIVSEQGGDSVLGLDLNDYLDQTISAGQTLTFTSPAGTYATLARQTATNPFDGGTLLLYELPGDALAGMPPAGLTLDIPGDVFPAFSRVAVPDMPAPLTDFSPPIGDSASANTAFSWTPSSVAGALVSLGLNSDVESIDCLLVDDGRFTLPDSVTAQLTGTFNGTVVDADRDVSTLERSGDAVVFVIVENTRGT